MGTAKLFTYRVLVVGLLISFYCSHSIGFMGTAKNLDTHLNKNVKKC
jgi:hypothetical protein